MRYAKLGKTDITVSAISMGCWQLGGGLDWGEQDKADSIATIHAAIDLGMNLFDTAEMYGNGESERILAEALKGRRQRVAVATKVHTTPMTREKVKKACAGSLKRLQTDYIDLYQIHFIDRNVPIEETLAAFEELKQEGKIRAAGTCNSGITDVKDLCGHGHVATNQMPYSLLWRAIELGIRKACMEHAVDLLCYSPLALGLLTGKFRSADEVPAGRARTRHFSRNRAHTRHDEPGFEEQTFEAINQVRDICKEAGISMAVASLAWVLAQEGVASVIVGARNPTLIAENVSAIEADVPTEVLQRLSAATRELRDLLGPNPDPWQSDSRAR